MFVRRCSPWVALCCFAILSVYAQTTDRGNSSNTTFKANVHVVVIDVVVTDSNGEPVTGLQQSDFQISEEGQPQTMASFEEHKGIPDPRMIPALPANTYTNFPVTQPPDSLDVILLDTLNTPVSNLSNVRLQLASFLKSIPEGSHIAIFTLSSDLRMVQGFSSDPAILQAALAKPGSRPPPSPLLGLGPAENLDTDINTQLAATGAGLPAAGVASMEKLQQFQNQAQNSQDQMRTAQTLKALQTLATYLAGVPGRKNVLWFSQTFPLSIIPGRGVQNYESTLSEQEQLRKTVNLLAAAQVSIYPISPEGLAQKFVSDESRVKSVSQSSWRTVQGQQIAEVTSPAWNTDQGLQDQALREHSRQAAHESTMDEIATDTGGEAFYNTNGFSHVLAHVIEDGARYYTITYSPHDKTVDGHFRRIDVKLLKGDYKLAYRRGYFSEEAGSRKNTTVQETRDPLRPLMLSGLPNSTQIVYEVRVAPLAPSATRPNTTDASAKTSFKGSAIRYSVNFAIRLPDLTFSVTPDGQHNSKIELALVAYDEGGAPLNSMVKSADVSLNPQLYAAFAKMGLQLHEEIDVPNGSAYLRAGICDLATSRSGTLQIPLNQADSRGSSSQRSGNR